MRVTLRVLFLVTGLLTYLFFFVSGNAVALETAQSSRQSGNSAVSKADRCIGVFIASDIERKRATVCESAIETFEAQDADLWQSRRSSLNRERRLSQSQPKCCKCCWKAVCGNMRRDRCIADGGKCRKPVNCDD